MVTEQSFIECCDHITNVRLQDEALSLACVMFPKSHTPSCVAVVITITGLYPSQMKGRAIGKALSKLILPQQVSII